MMKSFLWAAAALALVTPQLAMAQQHRDNRHDNQQAARPQRQQARPAARPAARAAANRQRVAAVRTRTVRETRTVQYNRAPARQTTRTVRTQQVSRVRNSSRRPAGYRPARVERVRATAFRYPRGYSYRRWNTGSILPRIFLSSAYYYPNWYDLGFGPPPPGYQWVRYGSDLLLVNVYTGRIRDVAYNVFY